MKTATPGAISENTAGAERLMAYRFALDLTPAQVEAALSHVGARRFAYNHMLALVKANISQREAERSYGISDELLTPPLDWSGYGLRRLWNTRKDIVAPWWRENSKEAYADGCARLALALGNWAKGRSGERRIRKGFPRFTSGKGRQSVTFTTGGFRLDGSRHIVLPKLGRLRTYEDTSKLLARIANGTAKITRATLSFERGRWFVSFTTHAVTDASPQAPRLTAAVGVDVGVKDLLVVADQTGRELERLPAPRHLAEAQRRLLSLQRKAARQIGPYDPARKCNREASAGWKRTQARIARVHARVANLRDDALHQATTKLVRFYSHIVIEDLDVRSMSSAGGRRKKGLNRAIADASFGKLAWMLSYKTAWAGTTLTRADRWFPSSKTCSGCGVVKAKLRLSERTYRCDHCGVQLDRDLNAATNLARVASLPAGVPGRNASGAIQKTSELLAGGCEAGTYSGRSATSQGVAAWSHRHATVPAP